MKLITNNAAFIGKLRCSRRVTDKGAAANNGTCDYLWVRMLVCVQCSHSPISGVAGPLRGCPGAAWLQLSTHAHVCMKEQPINFVLTQERATKHEKGSGENKQARSDDCLTCTLCRTPAVWFVFVSVKRVKMIARTCNILYIAFPLKLSTSVTASTFLLHSLTCSQQLIIKNHLD